MAETTKKIEEQNTVEKEIKYGEQDKSKEREKLKLRTHYEKISKEKFRKIKKRQRKGKWGLRICSHKCSSRKVDSPSTYPISPREKKKKEKRKRGEKSEERKRKEEKKERKEKRRREEEEKRNRKEKKKRREKESTDSEKAFYCIFFICYFSS
jgi:hypothetical protein